MKKNTITNAEKRDLAKVPAVERAIKILNYLQTESDPEHCTVTRIASAVDIHKSSCSNILRTLEAGALVEYELSTKSYMLGAALIGLGAVVTQRRDIFKVGRKPIEELVRQTGLSCVIFTQLPDDQFLIIASVNSDKDVKVTIDVGQYFSPGTPALARIAMAQMTKTRADKYISDYCQHAFTPETKTDSNLIRQEVEKIQKQGYAISEGEYYAGNTVIAAPIFTAQDDVCRGLCLTDFTGRIKKNKLELLGEKVKDTAQIITAALGGRMKLAGQP